MHSVGSSSTGWNGAKKIPLRSLRVMEASFDVLMAVPPVMTCCQRPVAAVPWAIKKYFTSQSTFTISTGGPNGGNPMSEHTDSLRSDISFMRDMAEKGRRGPILGGAF